MPGLFSVGLVVLLASYLPHFSCAQRLLAERMITIVAYFRAEVVNFIFGGRNSGQSKKKTAAPALRRVSISLLRSSNVWRLWLSIAPPGIMGNHGFGDCKDAGLAIELDPVGGIRRKLDFAGFCPKPGDYVPNRTSPPELRQQ